MAISTNPDEYMYQMEKIMRQKEYQMEMKMRRMQGYMQQPYPYSDQEIGQKQQAEPEKPKKPKHLNPKLLITKGSK